MNWLALKNILRKKTLTNKILEFKCENSGISYPVNIKVTKRKKTISIRIDKNKILVNNCNNIVNEIINIITCKNLNFESVQQLKNICEKIFINCYDVTSIVASINKILF